MVGRLVGWSVGRLVGWMVAWLVDWLIHWLVGSMEQSESSKSVRAAFYSPHYSADGDNSSFSLVIVNKHECHHNSETKKIG